jgi:hypothetical protein
MAGMSPVMKRQSPISKLQRNFKEQAPRRAVSRWSLMLGIWCLIGAWSLELGAFPPPPPLASRYNEAYPQAASKKGLQVETVEDALALGVKHAALNFNLSQLIDLRGETDSPSWTSAGRTYRFKRSSRRCRTRECW